MNALRNNGRAYSAMGEDDQQEEDYDIPSYEDRAEVTPLPTLEIGVVCAALFIQAYHLTNLFPYVGLMVQRVMGLETTNESGYYAGFVASSFTCGVFLSSYFWGVFADRFGRKPVIVIAMASIAVLSIVFGVSTSLTMAISVRFVMGLLNGIMAASRTTMAEICGQEHMVKGMACIAGARAVGLVMGPGIAGLLAMPADNYPRVFSQDGLFGRYPFLLPNLFGAVAACCVLPPILLFLPETYDFQKRRNHEEIDDDRNDIVEKSPGSIVKKTPRSPSQPHPFAVGDGVVNAPGDATGASEQQANALIAADDNAHQKGERGRNGVIVGDGSGREGRQNSSILKNCIHGTSKSVSEVRRAQSRGNEPMNENLSAAENGKLAPMISENDDKGSPGDRRSEYGATQPSLVNNVPHEDNGRQQNQAYSNVNGLAAATPGMERGGSEDESDTLCCGPEALLHVRHVKSLLIMSCLLSTSNIGLDEVFPLWALSTVLVGGLGWTSSRIGQVLSVTGAGMIMYQFLILPAIVKRIGMVIVVRVGLLLAIPAILTIPYVSSFGLDIGGTFAFFSCLLLVLQCSVGTVMVALTIASTSAVPMERRGKLTGLVMTAESLGRFLAPAGFAIAYAWSVSGSDRPSWVNHHFVFYIPAIIYVLVFLLGCQSLTSESMKEKAPTLCVNDDSDSGSTFAATNAATRNGTEV